MVNKHFFVEGSVMNFTWFQGIPESITKVWGQGFARNSFFKAFFSFLKPKTTENLLSPIHLFQVKKGKIIP